MSGGRRRFALAAVSAGNFSQLGARLLLGAVVPFVLVDFGTTEATVGLALTGMWAMYALLQFPSGVLADRFGERPVVLAGIVGAGVGTALVALSASVLAFGAATLVLGAGAGLFFSPGTSLLSRLYDERGGALSVLTGAGAVAGAAFPWPGACSPSGSGGRWPSARARASRSPLPPRRCCSCRRCRPLTPIETFGRRSIRGASPT